MHYIDHKFVNLVSSYLLGWKYTGNDIYRFRCPFCGDSAKNKSKKRGYIYTHKDSVRFKCHNCGRPMFLAEFLKEISPSLAAQYRYEKFVEPNKRTKNEIIAEETSPDVFKTSVKDQIKLTHKILGRCQKISDLPRDHDAIRYLDSRKIPEHQQNRLFYVDDTNIICRSIPAYHEKQLRRQERAIVIPFFDSDGILVYLQCRFMDAKDSDLRYMTFEVEENTHKIFGLDKIDWTKRVWIFEGPFDSMFVPNSLAVAGVSLLSEVKYLRENAKGGLTFVFDKDYQGNADVFNQLKKAIDMGLEVVIFDKSFPGKKDANDAIKAGWNVNQLEQYLKDRACSGLKAKLALSTFKPPKREGQHDTKNRKG